MGNNLRDAGALMYFQRREYRVDTKGEGENKGTGKRE